MKQFYRMCARYVVALAASVMVAATPFDGHTQQPGRPRHIALMPQVMSKDEPENFRRGLRDAGYSEGRDIVVEWHIAPGDAERIPALIDDFVQRKVDVIVVTTTVAAQAAKRGTSTIPIVMTSIADPVGAGLVESLAHPGGNVTGLSLMESELHVKRLELLREALPEVARVAVLWNPSMPSHPRAVETLKAAAPSMSIALQFVSVQSPEQLGNAFSTITKARAQALYVLQDHLFTRLRGSILKMAADARLPVLHADKYVVETGALLSYGPHVDDLFRRAAGYVDRILRGAKPADLPIEQPSKFELAVNLRTAKQLGIRIPQSIVMRADEVIR